MPKFHAGLEGCAAVAALVVMFLCIATTLIAAEISAVFANNAPLKKLNKAVGVCLLIFAVVLILLNVFGKTA